MKKRYISNSFKTLFRLNVFRVSCFARKNFSTYLRWDNKKTSIFEKLGAFYM